MISPALPALTALMTAIERVGQVCALAAEVPNSTMAPTTVQQNPRMDVMGTSPEAGTTFVRMRSLARVGNGRGRHPSWCGGLRDGGTVCFAQQISATGGNGARHRGDRRRARGGVRR